MEFKSPLEEAGVAPFPLAALFYDPESEYCQMMDEDNSVREELINYLSRDNLERVVYVLQNNTGITAFSS